MDKAFAPNPEGGGGGGGMGEGAWSNHGRVIRATRTLGKEHRASYSSSFSTADQPCLDP